MKRDRAENIIRQKVKGLEARTSVETDVLWERLNSRREEAPKRRRFPLYYAAAAVLLVIVCITALRRGDDADKDPVVVKTEMSLEAGPARQRQSMGDNTQNQIAVEQSRQHPKKQLVSRHLSRPENMIDDESFEQLGKEADYGLDANPIASNACRSVNDNDFSIN